MDMVTLLEAAKRVKSIAQTGLLYSEDAYNIERYRELEAISLQFMQLASGEPLERISGFFMDEREYPTPKTDVRAVIFNEHSKILLIREKEDNKWALPGGWADIGSSPSEMAVREVAEETGFLVRPRKLLAVLDKRLHGHPPHLEYVYKHFIECTITGGTIITAHDVLEVSFFAEDAIPILSEKRVTPAQIRLMFEFLRDPLKEAVFD